MKLNQFKYLLLIYILIISCISPKLVKLQIDDNFNYKNIINKNIYITPVIYDNPNILNVVDLDKIMNLAFSMNKKKYKFILSHDTINNLNEHNIYGIYFLLKKEYSKNFFLNSSTIKKLQLNSDGYIIFSYIYKFTSEKGQHTSYIKPSYPKNKETEYEPVTKNYAYSNLSGKLSIFDLKTGKLVFSAVHDVFIGDTSVLFSKSLPNSEKLIFKFYDDIINNFPE